ncbi:hypothetical protein LEMLEM_LOCUS10206 [Lemmus lemmus]
MALSTWSEAVVHVWVLSTWETEAEGNRVQCQPAFHAETLSHALLSCTGHGPSVTSPHPDTSLRVSILRFSHLENECILFNSLDKTLRSWKHLVQTATNSSTKSWQSGEALEMCHRMTSSMFKRWDYRSSPPCLALHMDGNCALTQDCMLVWKQFAY